MTLLEEMMMAIKWIWSGALELLSPLEFPWRQTFDLRKNNERLLYLMQKDKIPWWTRKKKTYAVSESSTEWYVSIRMATNRLIGGKSFRIEREWIRKSFWIVMHSVNEAANVGACWYKKLTCAEKMSLSETKPLSTSSCSTGTYLHIF